MSEDEKQYRRMRDLNNAASKRCRVGRKRKSEVRFFLLGYGLMTCFYEYSEYKSTKKCQMLKIEKNKTKKESNAFRLKKKKIRN